MIQHFIILPKKAIRISDQNGWQTRKNRI